MPQAFFSVLYHREPKIEVNHMYDNIILMNRIDLYIMQRMYPNRDTQSDTDNRLDTQSDTDEIF